MIDYRNYILTEVNDAAVQLILARGYFCQPCNCDYGYEKIGHRRVRCDICRGDGVIFTHEGLEEHYRRNHLLRQNRNKRYGA